MRALPAEYRCDPSRDPPSRPARSWRVAARCRSRRTAAPARRRRSRTDAAPAVRPDSPSSGSSRTAPRRSGSASPSDPARRRESDRRTAPAESRGGRPPRSATKTGWLASPAVHLVQLLAPPAEQAQTLLLVADLVAQIVGPAAEGVDVVEILVQALGQQEADDVEILVVMGGQPARVGFGFRRRCSGPPWPPAIARSPLGASGITE